jgi:hypothetical protein
LGDDFGSRFPCRSIKDALRCAARFTVVRTASYFCAVSIFFPDTSSTSDGSM